MLQPILGSRVITPLSHWIYLVQESILRDIWSARYALSFIKPTVLHEMVWGKFLLEYKCIHCWESDTSRGV